MEGGYTCLFKDDLACFSNYARAKYFFYLEHAGTV